MDNGAIRFTHVRVPRGNLLDRFASVNRSGKYSSPLSSASKRFAATLGELTGGRVGLTAGSLGVLKVHSRVLEVQGAFFASRLSCAAPAVMRPCRAFQCYWSPQRGTDRVNSLAALRHTDVFWQGPTDAAAMQGSVTIAIRYSAQRQQFGPPDGAEIAVLDYQTQQRKLLPMLATAYALHFAK